MPGPGCAASKAARSIRFRPPGSGSTAPSPSDANVRPRSTEQRRLTQADLASAVDALARHDVDLAGIVARHGPPPLWNREPGFATLLHVILEQQVSLASAQAAFDRLSAAADPLTPGRFLELTDAELLTIGLSRQKARYGRALAEAIQTRA